MALFYLLTNWKIWHIIIVIDTIIENDFDNVFKIIMLGMIKIKKTKQKEMILSAVFQNKEHPTADTIYSYLKADNPTLSLGTVYRNLNRFAQKGDIKKVILPNGSDRFDFNVTQHNHILCEGCGNLFDINLSLPEIENLVQEGEDEFIITGHNLMLYGICKECSNKN